MPKVTWGPPEAVGTRHYAISFLGALALGDPRNL